MTTLDDATTRLNAWVAAMERFSLKVEPLIREREAYARGEISIEVFERRLDLIFGLSGKR